MYYYVGIPIPTGAPLSFAENIASDAAIANHIYKQLSVDEIIASFNFSSSPVRIFTDIESAKRFARSISSGCREDSKNVRKEPLIFELEAIKDASEDQKALKTMEIGIF